MQTLTINIINDSLLDKIKALLGTYRDEGVEIIAQEDVEDLKLLRATRSEALTDFEDYLKNED